MKNKINPPTYFLLLLVMQFLLHFIYPVKGIVHYPHNLAGIVLILFGVILNLWTDNLFKTNKTTVKPIKKPTKFITTGPFKLSRHPMYLGMEAVLLGVSILLGTLITFIIPIVFLILMEILFIPMEEKNLGEVFGSKYHQYKRRVRRWL